MTQVFLQPQINMVFESLVASLLNKFLGDYVQNFDSSQLKLGIWGGKYRKQVIHILLL